LGQVPGGPLQIIAVMAALLVSVTVSFRLTDPVSCQYWK